MQGDPLPRGNTQNATYRLEDAYRRALRQLAKVLCPPRRLRVSEANAIRCLVDDALERHQSNLEKPSEQG